jgi:hypothetical protein
MVEKVKTLTAKEKTSEFKSQRERDQLSAALENEEHCGRTWAFSLIASWKEGSADEIYTHNPKYKDAKQVRYRFSVLI